MRPLTTLLLVITIVLFDAGAAAAATPGPALHGRAVAADEPVAGARVTLTAMAGHWLLGARFLGLRPLAAPVVEAETDGDGRFTVVAPAVGFWHLKLAAPGLAPFERLLLDVVEDAELGRFELQPAEVLEVVVVDSEQQPLKARVSVFRTADALRGADLMSLGHRWRVASSRDSGTPWRMLATDAEGRLTVDVAGDDRLLVRAVAPGSVAAEAMARGGGTVRLTLHPGVERRLQAVDVHRRPLSGVLVYDERAEVPLTATGEVGGAVLTWEGTAALRIALLDAEGRRATAKIDAPVREAPPPPEDEVVTVVLAEPATLTGRLIDRFTREPIAGALVWSDDLGNHARSGPAGDYQLLRLARRATVTALAAGYLRRWATTDDDGPAPTLPLHPTVTVSGRVVDTAGGAVAGAEIEVRRDLGRPEVSMRFSGWGAGSLLGRSADDGSFRIGALPARMAFLLSARRPGWAEAELEIDPLDRFAHRDGLHLVLEAGRRALGTVVDARRQPVTGATVTVSPRGQAERRVRGPRGDGGRRPPQGSSDERGRFAVADLAAGGYDLSITAPDHAPAKFLAVEVLAAEETDLGVFVLAPGAVVEGLVVDRDGRPVAGAEVRISNDPALPVSRARQALARQPAAAISDAEGRFTLVGQRPGAPVTLVIDSAAHLPEVVGGLTAPSPQPVEIVLWPPSRVAGRVLDRRRQGVPEAQLMLIPEGRAGSGGFGGAPLRAESRDDGSFEIHRVPAGRITLFCSAAELQDARLSGLEVPEAGELAGVEVAMGAGSSVAGVVLDPDGEAVVNALVQLLNYRGGRKRALTDGDGRYRLAGLATTTVSLAADHHDFPRVARDLDLEPGANAADLVFGGGVAVSGRVHDELGRPVAGAWVRLVRAVRSRHSPRAVAGEDGGFLFAGVARGDYSVEAGRRGLADRRRELPLQVREEAIAGVDIELLRGASLEGRILGLAAAELARVGIVAYGELGLRRGEVDRDAGYRVDHLGAGDWAVRAAVEPGGRAVVERVTVEGGQDEVRVDLDFSAGFTLTGTAFHDGAPLPGARVGARGLSVAYAADTTTDREGSFRLEGLEEGRYWVGLYDYGSGLRHSREIDLDGDRELRIELVTAEVSGMAVNALDHEPVADVRVVLEPVLDDQEIAARLLQPAGISDSGGHFSLGEVSHGRYLLIAARPGYAESRMSLEVGGPVAELEVELEPTAGVFFELALADAGAVDWATAVVLDGDRPVARGTWATSEKGRIRLTGVPPGSYEMLIAAPGSATLSRPVLSPGDLGRIVLPRGGTVDVAVPELADDGTVAVLRLVGGDGRRYRSVVRARVEDEFRLQSGRARIAGVPAGNWSLFVDAADGRSWTAGATVTADQMVAVTVE